MSMRRGTLPQRSPRVKADEHAAFIRQNYWSFRHQKRDVNSKCATCWDEIAQDYNPACTECAGSGFTVVVTGPDTDLPRKRGIIGVTQPFGNFGNAVQTFKAGGLHERYSVYIQMDKNTGKDVLAGDRFIVNVDSLRMELVVMNNQPQLGGKVNIGWVAECASASNVVLTEIFGS